MTETATTTETGNGTAKIHKFEKAGLGKAPFTYTGCDEQRGPIAWTDPKTGVTFEVGSPGQPMGSCAFCGQGIAICCSIQSADGKRFHVGTTCVEKTGDRGIIDPVKRAIGKATTAKRHAREAARVEAAKAILDREDVRTALKGEPHPMGERSWAKNRSKLDWADWMMDNAGNAGKLTVARTVEKIAKGIDNG